jgi:hypothetical protein
MINSCDPDEVPHTHSQTKFLQLREWQQFFLLLAELADLRSNVDIQITVRQNVEKMSENVEFV